ncbi:MAG: hypothetical protein ACYDIC_17350 [Desulfobaccales bacterium]
MPEFVGRVIKKTFGKGSKSEHEAVYLETEQKQYVLRRRGGNPFYDEEMQKLVGKTIHCTGVVIDYALLISDWAVLDEGEK